MYNSIVSAMCTVKPLVDTTLIDYNVLPEQDSYYTNLYCFAWQNK